MSKASNVHPGHYKVAGRGRQGEGLLQEEQKRAYVDQRESVRRSTSEEQAGIPSWEATPPNLETTNELPPSDAKPLKKTRKRASRNGKTRGMRNASAKRTARARPAARRKAGARKAPMKSKRARSARTARSRRA